MNSLFNTNVKQNESFIKKLEELKVQWEDHKKKINSMKMNKSELIEYTKKISEGYVSNINIIVDISSILINYREFMNDLVKDMQTVFDDTKSISILSQSDLDSLKNTTDKKLDELREYFNKNLPTLMSEFKSKGFEDTAKKLGGLQSDFESIINSREKLVASGGAKKPPSAKKLQSAKIKK
jgi:hypothetical protein